jgi:uncharacterized protein YjbJ (UPF0337 family)
MIPAETSPEQKNPSETPSETSSDPTRKEEFLKTATAAKMSGAFNETAGFFKRKLGEFTDDSVLRDEGRDQQFLGKIHRFVGSLRSVRQAALQKVKTTRIESQKVCLKHGGRLLDLASDFVEDMKKAIFK